LRSVRHILDQAPNLLSCSLIRLSALHTILNQRFATEVQKIALLLLERGADPNQYFAGTTPWNAFLTASIHPRRLDRPAGTAKLIQALIDNGADLTSPLECVHAGSLPESFFREIRLASEIDTLPSGLDGISVSFSISAISILHYITDRTKELQGIKVLESCQLPDILEEERVEKERRSG
jgi:hypothetical protein